MSRYWTPEKPMEPFAPAERISLGTTVKSKLMLYKLTGTWLIAQLAHDGVALDKYELSTILSGAKKGARADEIIRRSLDILSEYALKWGEADGSN